MNNTAQQVLNAFTDHFPSQPRLFFSPGRINLIGEHVDYNDGYVMPAAIDKGVYYAVAPNGMDTINFYSVDFKESYSTPVNDIKKAEGWKNYVLSVVNEYIILGRKLKGFDCVMGGDIPVGAGMSSSAAVEGGLAYALNEIFGHGLNRVELALLCQRAEHNFPGVNCGIMDQFANMMGKKEQVLLLDCKSLEHEYLPLQLGEHKLVLMNTKVDHTLASGEYNIRRKQCEEGLRIMGELMGIRSFRDIRNSEDLLASKSLMGDLVYDRCRYVVEEIQRTRTAAEYLKQNDLTAFGKLMYATHEGLSALYGVSCDELDFLVQQAKGNAAVIGSRMMGGGFGGCTINIIRSSAVDDFIIAATVTYNDRFGFKPEAYIVETSDGTGEMKS